MKVSEIAELVGGELLGDGEGEILQAAGPLVASPSSLVFFKEPPQSAPARAGCIIGPADWSLETSCPVIRVADPKLAFAKVAALLHPRGRRGPGIHPTAAVDGSAVIAADSHLGAHVSVGRSSSVGSLTEVLDGCRIGEGVSIGARCLIHPNVTICDGSVIGDGAVIHAGAVIGADGFGFVRNGADGYVKFPQLGRVVIGDDVEIGANSCIDRGALGDTVIGDGTKIDNLVQIAHNVIVGRRVVIAAHTGISGSVTIEDDCVLAGQSGVGEGATLRSGASIGGQAGVTPNKIVRKGVWWGTPVQPLEDYLGQLVEIRGLKALKAKVAELQKKIDELTRG